MKIRKFAMVAVTAGLVCGGTRTAQAKDETVTLTGCVQGFVQGGYFLSDATDKKGKPKHYLLVNDNDELKQHEGRLVEVSGTPSPFGWSVKIKAQDGREQDREYEDPEHRLRLADELPHARQRQLGQRPARAVGGGLRHRAASVRSGP